MKLHCLLASASFMSLDPGYLISEYICWIKESNNKLQSQILTSIKNMIYSNGALRYLKQMPL